VDPSLTNDPRRVLPIAAHPARVTEDGALTNLLVLKQRGSHGGTISFTAHFICYHPNYAHSFAAFVTTNVLTAQTRVTYPEGFCYVITEEQASHSLARFLARQQQTTSPIQDPQGSTQQQPSQVPSSSPEEETPEPPTPSPLDLAYPPEGS
jgi:hypothetical protein